MAPKKTFLTYTQQKYKEFIAKKLAGQNEIIAFLAQLAKYHYQKTNIEKKNIGEIKENKLLSTFLNAHNNMFYSFYQDQKEEIDLSDNLYKKTIDWLIDEWNNIDPTNTNHSTNNSLVQIIQTITQKLSKGPYIDLALGTGRLLENLKLKQTEIEGTAIPIGNSILKTKTSVDLYNYGFDIDDNALYLADALLNYKNKDVILNFGNYKDNNSIRNVYKSLKFKELEKEYPVFMFDPPLGTKSIQAHPAEWRNKKEYSEIFKNNSSKDSTSDVLFLANYLFNAPEKSYFIGIFPESILNNNTKEYPNLRKYLIQNNLNYVILYDRPDSSRLVILVGTKDSTKLDENISLIKIFNQKGINNLSSEITTKISDDNIAITEAPRESFDIPYYNVQLPVKMKISVTAVKKHSVKELSDIIYEKEKDIFRYFYRIRKCVNENIFEDNIIQDEQPPIDQVPWYKDSSSPIAQCLRFFSNSSDKIPQLRFIENFESYNCNMVKIYFANLLKLYNDSRLDIEHETINCEEEIKNIVVKENNYIEKLIQYKWLYTIPPFLTNSLYDDIYKAYCQYWLEADIEKISELREKYSKAEISSGVKLLSNVGILKKFPYGQIVKDDFYIYNLYRPSFKFFDGGIL